MLIFSEPAFCFIWQLRVLNSLGVKLVEMLMLMLMLIMIFILLFNLHNHVDVHVQVLD